MKTINVRELRATIPHLKEALAREHELVLVSNGEPIARITPIATADLRPRLPSMKAFRESLPMSTKPIELLIREERDRR